MIFINKLLAQRSIFILGLGLGFFLAIAGCSQSPSSPTPTKPQTPLKVSTLNVWGLSGGYSQHLETRIEKLCQTMKEDPQWDVVLLQEVWREQDRKFLSRDCGYNYSLDLNRPSSSLINLISKAYADMSPTSSGLMILSRHPIADEAQLTYSVSGDWENVLSDGEALAQKGAIAAMIEHPQLGSIWVANTHLIANYSSRPQQPNPSYTEQRAQQFRELATWIKKFSGNYPTIVGGDFNLRPPHQEKFETIWNQIPQLFPNFKRSLEEKPIPTLNQENQFRNSNDGQVDHLFASHHFQLKNSRIQFDQPFSVENEDEEIIPLNLSDHFGVEAEWQLK